MEAFFGITPYLQVKAVISDAKNAPYIEIQAFDSNGQQKESMQILACGLQHLESVIANAYHWLVEHNPTPFVQSGIPLREDSEIYLPF